MFGGACNSRTISRLAPRATRATRSTCAGTTAAVRFATRQGVHVRLRGGRARSRRSLGNPIVIATRWRLVAQKVAEAGACRALISSRPRHTALDSRRELDPFAGSSSTCRNCCCGSRCFPSAPTRMPDVQPQRRSPIATRSIRGSCPRVARRLRAELAWWTCRSSASRRPSWWRRVSTTSSSCRVSRAGRAKVPGDDQEFPIVRPPHHLRAGVVRSRVTKSFSG